MLFFLPKLSWSVELSVDCLYRGNWIHRVHTKRGNRYSDPDDFFDLRISDGFQVFFFLIRRGVEASGAVARLNHVDRETLNNKTPSMHRYD